MRLLMSGKRRGNKGIYMAVNSSVSMLMCIGSLQEMGLRLPDFPGKFLVSFACLGSLMLAQPFSILYI